MTDEELKGLIDRNEYRFTEKYTRCFYEDEWEETRANLSEIFKFIKEILEQERNKK